MRDVTWGDTCSGVATIERRCGGSRHNRGAARDLPRARPDGPRGLLLATLSSTFSPLPSDWSFYTSSSSMLPRQHRQRVAVKHCIHSARLPTDAMLSGIVLTGACPGAWPPSGVGIAHLVNCNTRGLGKKHTAEGPKCPDRQDVERQQGVCMQHNCFCASQRP
jgi:hypothetical protein